MPIEPVEEAYELANESVVCPAAAVRAGGRPRRSEAEAHPEGALAEVALFSLRLAGEGDVLVYGEAITCDGRVWFTVELHLQRFGASAGIQG